MDTYTALHCTPGSLARFNPTGEFGTVLGTRTDELNVSWIEFEWSDASRTELPCTDVEDIQIEPFAAAAYEPNPEHGLVPDQARR